MLDLAYRWWNHGWNPSEVPQQGYFPGPQPISIERFHMPQLKDKEYAVCEKADGVRMLALWTRTPTERISVLMDRSGKVIPFTMKGVLPKFYEGTLLDVEVLEDNRMLVFDAARVCGIPCNAVNLWDRQDLIGKWVSKVLRVKSDPYRLVHKRHVPLEEPTKLLEKKWDYGIDGLIFTPVHVPLQMGTQKDMFKWKPKHLITIDFKVEQGTAKNSWKLYLQERGELVHKESIKSVHSLLVPGAITEFKKDKKGKWVPTRHRPDKVLPNSVYTYHRTLVNIEEDIEDHELLGLDGPLKIAYLQH